MEPWHFGHVRLLAVVMATTSGRLGRAAPAGSAIVSCPRSRWHKGLAHLAADPPDRRAVGNEQAGGFSGKADARLHAAGQRGEMRPLVGRVQCIVRQSEAHQHRWNAEELSEQSPGRWCRPSAAAQLERTQDQLDRELWLQRRWRCRTWPTGVRQPDTVRLRCREQAKSVARLRDTLAGLERRRRQLEDRILLGSPT